MSGGDTSKGEGVSGGGQNFSEGGTRPGLGGSAEITIVKKLQIWFSSEICNVSLDFLQIKILHCICRPDEDFLNCPSQV